MRRARVGVIVGLVVICYGVICGAADTVTGSFSQNEKTCSNEPGGGCTESDSPTIAPTFEDTSKAIDYIKEIITIAGSEDIMATESVTNLERLIKNLKTVDDSVAEIATLFSLIDTKIESQNIQGKEAQFSCYEKLSTKFNELESGQVSAVQPPAVPSSEINSITETLRDTFTSKFSSIFQNHLVGFHIHKDRNAVFNQICGVKPLLTNPANAAMRDSWNSMSSIVHQRFIEHSKSSVASMKTSVVTVLTSFANDNPLCGDLALKLSNQLSSKVDSIDSTALVPGFPGLPIQVDANSIRNDRLNHIKTLYETEWTRTKHRKKKSRGLFNLLKKRVVYYSTTSHQAARYSPDITAVQNALSTEGTNPWTTSFRGAADDHISSVANKLVETLKNTKRNTISSAKPELTQAVEKSRQVLETSRDAVNGLTASKDKLLQLQGNLKELMEQ